MSGHSFYRTALLLAGTLAWAGISMAQGVDGVSFNRHIRTILSNNCFQCHGPDLNQRQADLRLDRLEGALADRGGYAAIVPGKPGESELIARIFAEDEYVRMPPPESHKQLTDRQKQLLRQWIAGGATYEGHWAYEPIRRPEPPVVEGTGAPVRNPIDAFVQERLAAEGLQPSPEADRRTLIRRVYFDLVGLPPAPEQVHEFVHDRSPDALERVIDQLLASPHFAERQAIAWLDAVRYADTAGFHGDQAVNVWPYRDYVLQAFDENMPFDQFTREQLGGDLIPRAGRRGKVASAFNRLNRMTTEGGAQDKEYLAKYASDRVRTVSIVWLGSTMGCAECHDHKFDPFTSKDFYSMEAFFADIKEHGFYPNGFGTGSWGPEIKLPSDDQTAALRRIDEQLEQVREKLAAISNEHLSEGRAAWQQRTRELDAAKELGWTTPHPLSAKSAAGATMTIHESGDVEAGGHNPVNDTYTVTFKPGAGRWTALQLRNRTNEDYPGNRYARGWKSFVVTEIEVEAATGGKVAPIAIHEVVADRRGYDERFPAWAAIDSDPSTGWSYPHGHSTEHWIVLRFSQPVVATDSTEMTVRICQGYPIRHATIARFALNVTRVEGATADEQALPDRVIAAVRTPEERQSDEHRRLLAEHYRMVAPELTELRRQQMRLSGQRALLDGSIPSVLTTESVEPRTIRILPRGNWMDDSGEIVQPAIPEFLGKLETSGRATRLDLAHWLTSPENPLTARVIANRAWEQFFGTGLSRVLEDVGSQGEWPSHPDLLDWLASEFMQPRFQAKETHSWDFKHLVRTIVTSHTYRQSSVSRPELDERDPDNRLLARQSPMRLEAEIIRDNALAVSGLLVDKIGGPSVFPWQPAGYWAPLNFPKREWSASVGDNLHRRSLYTHWQRTFVHPSMLTFDAATREECQVRRAVSTTPLQALVLLNDPIFVEAAAHFAFRMLDEGGQSPECQIAWGFQTALAREPSEAESELLIELFDRQRDRFSTAPQDARKFLEGVMSPATEDTHVADQAAMAVVARAILNLSETITRY